MKYYSNLQEIEDLVIKVEEDQSEDIFILIDISGDEKVSSNIKIIHNKPGGKSNILIHSVIRDRAELDLIGRIEVGKNVPGVEANLLHKTLLLTNEGRVNTKPELIIEHDDVKCGHGATISGLNHKHLSYLESRGLNYQQSEELLVEAFKSVVLPK